MQLFIVNAIAVDFKQLDISSGLTTSRINTIFQDSEGFIWIGTDNGVNKYDGYQVQSFLYDDQNSSSVLGNSCNFISQDDDGRVWIGTELGVSHFEKNTNSFVQYPLYDLDNKIYHTDAYALIKDKQGRYILLSNNYLYLFDNIIEINDTLRGFRSTEHNSYPIKNGRGMVEDPNGNLYIVTEGNGVVIFNLQNKSIKTLSFADDDNASNQFLRSIFIDQKGRKWISTLGGAFFVLDDNDTPVLIEKELSNSTLFGKENIAISQATNGDIWFANTSALIRYNPKSRQSVQYNYPTENNQFLLVRCLYSDRIGNLWVGTSTYGVLLFTPSDFAQNFKTISTSTNPYKLSNPSVLSILKSDGKLLLGTDWGGLNVFDLERRSRIVLMHDDRDMTSLPNDAVTALSKDSQGTIWVGTYQGGLSKYDMSANKFLRVSPKLESGEPVKLVHITSIYEDENHNMWISTNGTGVFEFDRNGHCLKQYRNTLIPSGFELSTSNTLQILQESTNEFWIATYYGLNKYDKRKGSFEYYFSDEKRDNSLSHNWVLCMAFDQNRDLWLGTSNGLNRYNRQTNDFKAYYEKDGLPSNTIYSILVDTSGYLWMSTSKGISRFNIKSEKFDNFTTSDGLAGNEFLGRAAYIDSQGEFYFGGTTGLSSFYPSKLVELKQPLEVHFTSISALSSSKSSYELVAFDNDNRIEIDNNQTNLKIEFSTLTYSKIDQIRYAYQMVGIDTTWVDLGNSQSITFPKLPAGEYQFNVKASLLDDSSRAKISSLEIIVHPPFYSSFWAWMVYLLIAACILYLYQRFLEHTARMRSLLQMSELEKQKAEELYNEKLSFFSNVSHELKTPLTIILGYVEKIAKEQREDTNLIILKRNATKLQHRIEQLLDFQKVDNGLVVLNIQYSDIVGYLRLIMNEFSYEATIHNVEYTFKSNRKWLQIGFDVEIVDKIITNLLSNAFKFSPDGSKITLHLMVEEQINSSELLVKITVEDSGVGISDEDLPFIFDRFFSKPGLTTHKGTGIGLALAQELALLHRGRLEFSKSEMGGSLFCFAFSTVGGEDKAQNTSHAYVECIHKSSLGDFKNLSEPDFTLPLTMLVIDDHNDMRQYIGDIFQKEYNLIYAADGANGLEMVNKYQPDVVITDLMMPLVDGLELCKSIKSNISISHISIIIVTAVSSETMKIKGLEYGVDDFITKPFNSKELELKVRNILKRREQVAEYIKNSEFIRAEMVTSNPTDQIFMNRLIALIEKNASDSDFGIQNIISELGMSKSVFYRKVKSITNESIVDLIRTVRLKKAARLLTTTSLTVNEVAYQVGYSDAGYFIKVFKEYFDCTPGEYKSNRLK